MIDEFTVKVENTVTYNLDEPLVNQMFKELNELEKSALVFKPSLILKVYKKLPEKSLLHEAVTIKPSSPTLKIIGESLDD